MATVHLLLLLLSAISTVKSLERYGNISLGSSLSPTTNPTAWLSPSGLFAFGFHPQGNGFVIAIWFASIPQNAIVWTARQDDPIVPSNVSLIFTNNGLVLQHDQGRDNLIPVTGEPILAAVLDSGNFVFYDSESTITWQSFDSPTNTLLQGQQLSTGYELFSSVSEGNNSMRRFRLSMQDDGNLVQYPMGRTYSAFDAYWASNTNSEGYGVTLNLGNDGHLYLLNRTGFNIKNLTRGFSPSNGSVFYRMTLDADGILRLYSHSLDKNGNWSIRWELMHNKCAPKGFCGLNGLCVLLNEEHADCQCLPGFSFVQSTLDCKRNSSTHCTSEKEHFNVTMEHLENIEWEDDPYIIIPSKTEEDCKDACLGDCNCEAALFVDQNCKKQSLPLRFAKRQDGNSTKAFIKMSSPVSVLQASNNTITDKVSKTGTKKRVILIVGLSFLACSFILLAFSCILWYKNRDWAYHKILYKSNSEFTEEISLRSFSYGELEKATNNFKEEVGKGAFGTVFRGTLNSRKVVAIKRLERLIEEGEREFITEVRVIGRTNHKNLVRLLGYCHTGSNRLLVYEYMSNGSLSNWLFRSQKCLILEERARIALDIARGIMYLHEECETQIIHCDIKPSNILMDELGCAKIADFGLAKLLKPDQTKTFTEVRGTRGYLAPEWQRNLPITVKADIYSFGIVLLETICCRRSLEIERPDNEIVLVEWVYQCFEAGQLQELVSDEEVDMTTLERMVSVALWCIQDEPSHRPSMKKVVLMLEGTIEIPIPPVPTFFLQCH